MGSFRCYSSDNPIPIRSMYGIYANIWGILMVNVTIYIAYMDPMGYGISFLFECHREFCGI